MTSKTRGKHLTSNNIISAADIRWARQIVPVCFWDGRSLVPRAMPYTGKVRESLHLCCVSHCLLLIFWTFPLNLMVLLSRKCSVSGAAPNSSSPTWGALASVCLHSKAKGCYRCSAKSFPLCASEDLIYSCNCNLAVKEQGQWKVGGGVSLQPKLAAQVSENLAIAKKWNLMSGINDTSSHPGDHTSLCRGFLENVLFFFCLYDSC